MKQRFSSLDIKVIAHELSKSLLTLRVNNIYDLSSRIFLIKFAKPNHREQLVIDSGFRCHLTAFSRTTAAEPSAFVARLRKFLKTRRVTSISQVGTDRILELQFSDGQYRLFLEFYAGGNIVLTDSELKIIAILRNVNEGADYEKIRLGSTYNISERQNASGVSPITLDRVKSSLQSYIDRQAAATNQEQSKKAKKKTGDVLRKALAGGFSEFPPMLLDHGLRATGFDVNLAPEEVLNDPKQLDGVVGALEKAEETMKNIMSQDTVKGYIIARPSGKSQESEETNEQSSRSGLMYFDFHPFLPKQFESDSTVTALDFEGFNRTVDEFFSSIEGQKLESRLQEKEDAAKRKLENAKEDQAKRIGGLQDVQALNIRKAQAIEANLERVKEAMAAINDLIARGMDWIEIDRLIELEQKRQNPVAEVIVLPLKLQENTATLKLGEWESFNDEGYFDEDQTDSEPSASDDEDSQGDTAKKSSKKAEAKPDPRIKVDIDLSLSPWANAREYYDQKRSAAAKEEKTVQASAKALKSAQQKIDADLKKALQQEKQVLRPVRKQYWFEKFLYFISSDGYLVIGGKDAQQNDILYKRHLKKGDVYVHAEPNGASMVIIKNNPSTPDAPIPPSTLSQAGNLSIATSTCWDSKAVMSAWWVPAENVTKLADTGDYLSPGKFAIHGEKNYLPPAQLLLGFAVLFQISEASKAQHMKHRLTNTDIAEDKASKMAYASDNVAQQDSNDVTKPDDEVSEAAADESDPESDEEEAQASYTNPFGEINNAEADQDSNDDDEDDASQPAVQDADDEVMNPAADRAEPEAGLAETTAKLSLNEQPDGEARDSGTNDSAADNETNDDDNDDAASTTSTTAAPSSTPSKPKGAAHVRGKKGKRKKMATKYADQDEADREAAMRLLGSMTGQTRAAEQVQAARADDVKAAQAKARRREQHQRTQREGREQEQLRRLMQEGEPDPDNDPDDGAAPDLDALVGAPLPGDEILDAIPVCAPWSALGRCKYKAKLQPGAQKKGKAVREILGKWAADAARPRNVDDRAQDVERIWPREMELVRAWKDAEVFGVVPVGKVRVMMAGASAGGKGDKGGQQAKGKGRGGKGGKKSR